MRENLSTSHTRRATSALVVSCVAALHSVVAQGTAPAKVSTVPTHARRALTENSAAAMSVRQPGVFFTINDSNNQPVLYAMDTTGADRGAWRVLGADDVDWESAAVAPCGDPRKASNKTAASISCVYIGDTGDNREIRPSRRIYRAAEPTALARGATNTIRAEHLTYEYSDGPHDVEAMYVAANGDIFLITKRPRFGATRKLRPSLVFRLQADAWAEKGRTVAELVDSLPIVPGSAPLRVITDASLSPDGRHLAVRTYSQLFVFATDASTGRVVRSVAPAVCDLVPLGEPQGEGVTWTNNSGRLLFTSEGQPTPFHLANCPLP